MFNNFDTANSYDQQYILQAYADEYYRRDISRKIRKVFQVKADNGILKTILSYGYKRIDGMVIIDKEAEPVIREIFNRILQGESTADIAEDFNKRKIPTCKYEMGLSKKKTIWTSGTIRKILNNDFYLGKREVLKSSKSPLTYYHPAYFDFDYISNVRSKLVKKPRKDIDNLRLGKMIYYGNSKNAMAYKETKYTKKYVDHASTFKIKTSLLHELIFSEVREFIKLIKTNQNQFKEISLKYFKENKLSATRMECEQEIKKLEKKLAQYASNIWKEI